MSAVWRTKLRIHSPRRHFASVSPHNSQHHCRELVKKADYYNYLCTLLLPQPQQRFAFALRSLNVEVSLIRDRAPTDAVASLRYQYWLDSISTIFTQSQPKYPSPVEQELCWAIDRFPGVSRHWIVNLVQSRWKRAGGVPFRDCAELEHYAEATNAPIHYSLAEAFNIKSIELDHALSHMSKAQGILTHLRSVVPLAKQHRILLVPTDVLVEHKIPAEIFLRLCSTGIDSPPALEDADARVEQLRDVCHDIASLAHRHASKAAIQGQEVLARGKQTAAALLMLPLVHVCALLSNFASCNFDLRHPRLVARRDGLMPLRIAWCALRGKIASPPKA
uniref:NADH dehydrogenase (Ubiquinone) complex I, assembly factor 6 n=1 Tax=Mesocestoides corti TaxID=53468 RepID=A0A5K3EPB6_MESCO